MSTDNWFKNIFKAKSANQNDPEEKSDELDYSILTLKKSLDNLI